MIERAQRTIQQLYTFEKNAENIYQLYKDIIKKNKNNVNI
jgi:hypothetical protein